MPQLNPSPWLMILIFSWMIFLYFIPPKVSAHIFPHEPLPITIENFTTESWNWPWH
uniref:ATP synthase complex subunit 8 n=1 Tax=Ophichthys cuchia TaxID=2793285 RepID=A0A8E8P9V2_9TELE|nr:ATP synthase F0 subunit 8 [Ophichthys cuchia]QWE36556.1 ATP synthase F0 subunit 8 [Ophichthys cuchia]UZC55292.1 ATP synthase subunit 8 [Ophichthys cuchia]